MVGVEVVVVVGVGVGVVVVVVVVVGVGVEVDVGVAMIAPLSDEDVAWLCLEMARRDLERRMQKLPRVQKQIAGVLDLAERTRGEISAAMDLVEDAARELARVRDGRRAA